MIQLIVIGILMLVMVKLVNSDNNWLNNIKGNIGENNVANELSKLDPDYIIKNSIDEMIYINGYQIDHMIINNKLRVIYVVETKNWNGTFYGSKYDINWRNYYNQYKNPIIQNELHCNAVRSKYKNYDVVSIIVFANDNVRWGCKCKNIISINELVGFIIQDSNRRFKNV
jgi:hypothetical protein